MKTNKKIFSLIMAVVLCFFCGVSSYASNPEDEYIEQENEKQRQLERDYNVAVDFELEYSNLKSSQEGELLLKVKNTGGENIEKAKVNISSFPAELSLINRNSPSKYVGNLYVGNDEVIEYECLVNKIDKTSTFPITFEFKGNYGTSVNNFKEYTFSRTFYVKIEKNEENRKENYKPLIIKDIVHPAMINKGDIADVGFTVYNPNDSSIDSVKVTIFTEDGLVNKTQNMFVKNNFSANAEVKYNVQIFAKDDAQKKNHPIKILVEPSNFDNEDSQNIDENKKIASSTQYSGIFYNGTSEGGVKNPQIMISNYSYGSDNVEPNSKFPLTMTFVNTSEKNLKNIKISLISDEGTFIAVNTSNSFYIDSLAPKSSYTKTLNFSVKPDAQTKTVGINIDYAYEDESANTLSAKDTISIPVMQKTVFSVDDIVKPQEVFEGEPVNINAQFYNLGKTQISNLKVTAKGNFNMDSDSTYFVGNMESGKDDSFSISFIPNDYKKIKGSFDFTFETLDGKKETVSKKFDFSINPIPMQVPDNMGEDVEMEDKKSNKTLIISIVIGIIVGVVFVIMRKRKKKKQLEEFEIDE